MVKTGPRLRELHPWPGTARTGNHATKGLPSRLYQREFATTQNGKVGITLNIDWAEPANRKDGDHLEASNRAIQFQLGWFAHPIFINGAYPDVMRKKVDVSLLQIQKAKDVK